MPIASPMRIELSPERRLSRSSSSDRATLTSPTAPAASGSVDVLREYDGVQSERGEIRRDCQQQPHRAIHLRPEVHGLVLAVGDDANAYGTDKGSDRPGVSVHCVVDEEADAQHRERRKEQEHE